MDHQAWEVVSTVLLGVSVGGLLTRRGPAWGLAFVASIALVVVVFGWT